MGVQAFVGDRRIRGGAREHFLDHVRHRGQLRLNRPKRPDFRFIRDFVLPLPLALALPRALAFVSSLFFSGSWISPAILRSALQTFARLWVWARGFPLLAAALKTLGSPGSTSSTRAICKE